MTSDQERAAPAQQPVALTRLEQFIAAESADGTTDTIVSLRFLREIASALAVASLSEPELRAEIARLTRERDEARANHEYFATQWDERGYVLKAAESRVEALLAEVGTARAEAFEEAAQIADMHDHRGDISKAIRSHAAIRSRAALDKGATA